MKSVSKIAKKGFLLLMVLLFAWNISGLETNAAGRYSVSEIDETMKGLIRIEKNVTDLKDGTSKPVEGVSYQLTYKERLDHSEVKVEDKDYFREVRATDADGIAEFSELELGTYLVEEVGGIPEGYTQSIAFLTSVPLPNMTEVTYDGVTYEPGSIYEYDIVAKPKCQPVLGAVRLIKTDSETGKRLKGAIFALFKEDGTRYLTSAGEEVRLTTDSNGTLEVRDLLYGNYYFQEEEAPDGYQLSKEKYLFSITQNYIEGKPDTLVLVEAKNTPNPPETEPPTEPETKAPVPPKENPTPPPTKITIFRSPKTGDTTNIALWIILLGASAGAAGMVFWRKTQKKRRRG